jgi:hypothetical protein
MSDDPVRPDDLDDLRARWAEQDRKLDASLALNARLLRELAVDRTRVALGRFGLRTGADLAVDALLLLAIGSYVASRVGAGQWRFAVPGLALAAFVAWSFGSGVLLATRLGGVDYAARVVAIQKQLEGLRVLRIRHRKWIFLCAPLLWPPLFIVGLDLIGVDAYVGLGWGYILANVAFGAAAIPLLLGLARWPRLARTRAFRGLADVLAGQSLARARAQLASLAAFERE